MARTLDELLVLLDLEEVAGDVFRGPTLQNDGNRIFGGQVLGQALVAAARTVDEDRRVAHSLHAYFLRPGDSALPIEYPVERARDGRSFSARRVTAEQGDRTLFQLLASFHVDEPGYDHQAEGMVATPPPESLPSFEECIEGVVRGQPELVAEWMRDRAIDQRPADGFFGRPEKREPLQRTWIRSAGPLPESPAVHQGVFAYASDMSLIDTAVFPHGVVVDEDLHLASLDHAIWFHRPFRMDAWHLFVQDSPTARGARAFARGRLFTRDGELVASVAQEGLLRPTPDR